MTLRLSVTTSLACVGLEVLWRTGPVEPVGHRLLMVGQPGAAWHLELVEQPAAGPATDEDQLVVYLNRPVDRQLLERILQAGGHVVAAGNPYWDRWGVTERDPDGYRLVLCTRSWPG